MDRTSAYPKQDFEGMVCEIWSGLDICLYHTAYVRIYSDTTAMRLAGSRRREAILHQMPQADRDLLQEDVLVFRAHFAGVLWQLHHVADELIRLAYRRCYQEGIITKDRYDALVKALDDDPLLKEIRDYRNLSPQFAGVIMTLHDGTTHAFIAHVLPPLGAQAPAQQDSINEQEIRKEVEEREKAQWALDDKRSRADDVLDNSGSLERLARQVDQLLKQWGIVLCNQRRNE